MKDKVELDDIQGLVVRSYKDLKEASYLMLGFHDVKKAKEWIESIRNRITTARYSPNDFALHISFTYNGIRKLVPESSMTRKFSREFTEGIVSNVRSRILGDIDENSPENWQWNGATQQPVDIVLMLYAENLEIINEKCNQFNKDFNFYEINLIAKLDTTSNKEGKEHFGFRDGISNPLIKGLEKEKQKVENRYDDINTIMPGEFILGYHNEYQKVSHSPSIEINSTSYDLGKNGSYMVFRQLEQDVKGFWQFIYNEVKINQHFAGKDPVYLASKMVGRWPNGNPLTEVDSPHDPELNDLNSFLFKDKDPHGFRCPIGAHIRKTNPRDGMDEDPITSILISKRHRIIRRGRLYGTPLARSMESRDMLASSQSGKRGIFFICFNTSIKRQFEFIQTAWANSPKFDGLSNDVDPIVGFPYLEGKYKFRDFTVQGCPIRKRIEDIPQFVFVRGGAYFFMPGINALRILSCV